MKTTGRFQEGVKQAKPDSAKALINRWRERGSIPVPTKDGHILDALIVSIEEGAPVIVEARATHSSPIRLFAVVIDPDRLAPGPIPALYGISRKLRSESNMRARRLGPVTRPVPSQDALDA